MAEVVTESNSFNFVSPENYVIIAFISGFTIGIALCSISIIVLNYIRTLCIIRNATRRNHPLNVNTAGSRRYDSNSCACVFTSLFRKSNQDNKNQRKCKKDATRSPLFVPCVSISSPADNSMKGATANDFVEETICIDNANTNYKTNKLATVRKNSGCVVDMTTFSNERRQTLPPVKTTPPKIPASRLSFKSPEYSKNLLYDYPSPYPRPVIPASIRNTNSLALPLSPRPHLRLLTPPGQTDAPKGTLNGCCPTATMKSVCTGNIYTQMGPVSPSEKNMFAFDSRHSANTVYSKVGAEDLYMELEQ